MIKQLRLFSTLLLFAVASMAWSDSWVKTDASALATGDIVVIVDETSKRAMSNNNGASSAPTAIAFEATNVTENLQWEVTVNNDSYQFKVPGTSNYLYCTNNNNGIRVGTNDNNAFTIFDNEGVSFLLNTATNRYIGVYDNQDWRCYTSINNNIKNCVLAFYKLTSDGTGKIAKVTITPTKINIGETAEVTSDGPSFTLTSSNTNVATVNGSTVTGVAEGTATITATWQEGTVNDVLYAAGTKDFELTVVDADAGTENKPYTVAQARAAIDAGTGVTGVYAKGIVSKIVTAYNSQYGNITYNISADGTTESDQLQAYRGKSYSGENFTSENDILVGDEVVVFGNLTKHNSTYEFEADNQLVSLVRQQATVADPVFTPAAGSYTDTQTVTITCETEGATIYYTLDGTDPTKESTKYTAPITVNETTTIKAIAYDATGSSSAITTAEYTILSVQTIAEVRDQQTGTVLTTGIVTSCVSKTAYIQDETAAICVYGAELTVGDKISVKGTLATFNGLLEIKDVTYETISSGNTVYPTTMTIAEINASTKQGWFIKIENATVTSIDERNTTIAQGENTIVVRDIPSDVEYSVNDVLTLSGNIGCFNGVQIANPTNVEVQASQTPAIEAANKIELAYDATSGEIDFTIKNPTEGTALTATADAEWISNITVGTDKVTFSTTVNEGSEDRTANIKLAYSGAEDFVVAVIQGHLTVDYAELPFSYDEGRPSNVNGLTAEGLGTDYKASPYMKFDSTDDYLVLKFNERPGVLTFDIKGNSFENGTFAVQTSEDGETYTDLATYTELGVTQNEEFDALGENVRYIKWIYTEKVTGNVALGNIVLKKYETPKIDPELSFNEQEVTVTIEDTFTGLTLNNKFSVSPITYSSSNENVATVNETGVVEIAGTGKTTITASFAGNDTYKTSSASYMLTVAKKPAEGDVKFEIVTPNDELTDGEYLIVYRDETMALAFDGSLETLDAASNTQVVTIVNDAIMTTNAIAFTIAAKEGGYSIKSASGLYIGNTSDANALKTSATDDYVNTITINEDGNADIISSNSFMRYNATNNQDRFRYYNSGSYTNQKAIKLYRKVADSENKKGDVNNDGSVTIADVTALVNIILGKSENYDSKVADVNEDGSITIADVTSLVNIILGKTN